MKALLALAAIAVAVIAGLKMSLPPVGRPCAGCGYPPGQGHNDRCPRRRAPLPESDEVVGMPTELSGVSWGQSGPHLTFNTGVEQPQPWLRYVGTDWDAWMAEHRRNHPDWRN